MPKMFLGLFRAKMTTIGIQNPKLIVNDFQQGLAHFEWFLALFHNSDKKPELLQFKRKVRKNGIFGAKNLFAPPPPLPNVHSRGPFL